MSSIQERLTDVLKGPHDLTLCPTSVVCIGSSFSRTDTLEGIWMEVDPAGSDLQALEA
jgi:hypothetical protein